MSAYYIRHEILRHEIVRKYSMINVDHNEKNNIAKLGFYADIGLEAFICFSCNLVVKFRSVKKNIHKIHAEKSKLCAFLQGRDVSINDRNYTSDYYSATQILGFPLFNNPQWFSRKICKILKNVILSNTSLENPQLIHEKKTTKRKFGNLHLPFYIPPINDSNKYFHIETFFITMRNEERRLETFNQKLFPFPFNEKISKCLAENGFFYTLLNSSVQCAFCRIVIGNLYEDTDIKFVHKLIGVTCPIAKDEVCDNEKIVVNNKKRKIVQTDIEEIQCKICLNNKIDIVFNCGYFVCSECAINIDKCHYCRSDIKTKSNVYI